jgi:hypothetical protein
MAMVAMTASHKPTAGLWIAVALVAVLVGYPLSTGPVGWFEYRLLIPMSVYNAIYAPVDWVLDFTPEVIADPYRRYNTWCATRFPSTLMHRRNRHVVPAPTP